MIAGVPPRAVTRPYVAVPRLELAPLLELAARATVDGLAITRDEVEQLGAGVADLSAALEGVKASLASLQVTLDHSHADHAADRRTLERQSADLSRARSMRDSANQALISSGAELARYRIRMERLEQLAALEMTITVADIQWGDDPEDADTVVVDVALDCPMCRGPVYVPDDSDREGVDCAGCGDPLITRQGIDGVVVVVDEATLDDRRGEVES